MAETVVAAGGGGGGGVRRRGGSQSMGSRAAETETQLSRSAVRRKRIEDVRGTENGPHGLLAWKQQSIRTEVTRH